MNPSKNFPNTPDGIIAMSSFIISSFGNIEKYMITDEDNISAIFLAGAPGSGKSEFLETILCDLIEFFIVIDIDVYRNMFKGYNGANSSEYQQGAVRVADKILKFCFQNNLSFILDGTFRNYHKVEQNLHQCEKYKRKSLITLIFQEPKISFYYTFLRKLDKKRNVPVSVFVDGFYDSIKNAFRAVDDFESTNMIIAGKKLKDIDGRVFDYKIYSEIENIFQFCDIFRIEYIDGVFSNKEKVRVDIENFQTILIEQFSENWTIRGMLQLLWFKLITRS